MKKNEKVVLFKTPIMTSLPLQTRGRTFLVEKGAFASSFPEMDGEIFFF